MKRLNIIRSASLNRRKRIFSKFEEYFLIISRAKNILPGSIRTLRKNASNRSRSGRGFSSVNCATRNCSNRKNGKRSKNYALLRNETVLRSLRKRLLREKSNGKSGNVLFRKMSVSVKRNWRKKLNLFIRKPCVLITQSDGKQRDRILWKLSKSFLDIS